MYEYLQDKNNDHGWLAGFRNNDIRRVDTELTFEYYDNQWHRVPKCMELTTMQDTVDLGYNKLLLEKVRKENESGRHNYVQAMRDHRA